MCMNVFILEYWIAILQILGILCAVHPNYYTNGSRSVVFKGS